MARTGFTVPLVERMIHPEQNDRAHPGYSVTPIV